MDTRGRRSSATGIALNTAVAGHICDGILYMASNGRSYMAWQPYAIQGILRIFARDIRHFYAVETE